MEDKDSPLYQMINLFYWVNAMIQIDDIQAGNNSGNFFRTRAYEMFCIPIKKNTFQSLYFLISLQKSAHHLFYI